ncbi:HAD hydrolase family protein [Gemmiger formicilis]|uniref:HAD hydrolase family protein n=1 Tax=Gemmiger formicilis TaxID=745368 RepID=UPI002942A7FF|nr:HAD hydrolase family protein [Gemmiger formicilis]
MRRLLGKYSLTNCGVAMGNACDAAKAAADYVTDDITADGLAKALAHFGLI